MTTSNFKLDIDATDRTPHLGRAGPVDERHHVEGIDELSAIVETLASDAAVKGVVITSAKDTFCAGADLSLLEVAEPQRSRKLASRTGRGGCRAAAVRGEPQALAAVPADRDLRQAMGRGASTAPRSAAAFELALACHYRVAGAKSEDPARPAGDQGRTVSRCRRHHARRHACCRRRMRCNFLLKGDHLSHERAKAMKLIDAVVPPDELIKAAKDWIKAVARPHEPLGRRRRSGCRVGRSIPRPA